MQNIKLQDIRQLRNKEDRFFILYQELITKIHPNLTDKDKIFLLKLAIIFLNQNDLHINKLGYRIIVEYSIKFNDYEPLYEIALSLGYIPIAKFIEEHHIQTDKFNENFFLNWLAAFNDTFNRKGIYLSCQQQNLFDTFIKNKVENLAVVAPTSYGKSELIIEKVLNNLDKKICIIVPSKALLAQTKRRLIKEDSICNSFKKIVTHPELFKGTEDNVLAVLTQERLQALLNKFPNNSFDFVLIDEAHNIFSDDDRAMLLGQVLLILKKRNPNIVFNYFSPFISDTNSLKMKHTNISLVSKNISEQLKIERFYIFNEKSNNKLIFYDQCLNMPFELDDSVNRTNPIDFILNNSGRKNILYINTPKSVENFVLEFIENLPNIENIENSNEFIAIRKYAHVDYNLLKCLKKGVVYHHAGMPDIIKLYVEKLFSKNSYFKYIVTTSTLLEGINIPADKMFILDLKKGDSYLNSSQFKNLIGRVCRFKEIFDKENGSLNYLRPEVYIVNNPIMTNNANITGFLKKVLNLKEIDDVVENVLLEKCEINENNKELLDNILDHIENIEPDTIADPNIQKATSIIGKLCYKHNIHDFNIKESENQLIENYKSIQTTIKISTVDEIIETINSLFFSNIELKNENIKRFQKSAARNFYKVFLSWRTQGKPFSSLIGHFTSYWNRNRTYQRFVYVGRRWGKVKKYSTSRIPLYIDLTKENNDSLINIAILRVKEEQDFVDNFLIKYIEVLNDLELLEPNLYNSIKYGSINPIDICLLKNGFSIELTECITQEKYSQYINLDVENCEIVSIDKQILNDMEVENENPILLFELKYHI